MAHSKDGLYAIRNNKVVPIKVEEMEWLLRYGREQDILDHRLYIAHILNLYRDQSKG